MMESGGWKELEATVLQNIESVKKKKDREGAKDLNHLVPFQ